MILFDWIPRVLIETYWNVKNFDAEIFEQCTGSINRNILECKVKGGTPAELGRKVLIETYWNVKVTS